MSGSDGDNSVRGRVVEAGDGSAGAGEILQTSVRTGDIVTLGASVLSHLDVPRSALGGSRAQVEIGRDTLRGGVHDHYYERFFIKCAEYESKW